MALYVCESCGCIENTALSRFWRRNQIPELDGRALCSDCDPETAWHGRFPRRMYIPHIDHVQFKDGEWISAAGDGDERSET